jgi:VWFA-related protein
MDEPAVKAVKLLVALFVSAIAFAQAPPFVESIDVSIVNLDVVVTDRRGNHVAGLTRDDFEVFENGKRQPLTHFVEYASGVGRGAAGIEGHAPEAMEPRQKRTLVLLVDQLSTRGSDRKRLFAELKRFAADSVHSGDAMAVVEWHRGLQVIQDFTDDRAAIDRAIDRIAVPKVEAQFDEAEHIARMLEVKQKITARAGGGFRERESAAIDAAERQMAEMRGKTAALRMLVNSMAARDGRKALVMLTQRYSSVAGFEFLIAGAQGDMAGAFTTRKLREGVMRAANAAGVTMYPLFPEGLLKAELVNAEDDSSYTGRRRVARSRPVFTNEARPIVELAAATGGLAAWSTSDIARMLPRIAADLDSYYSLAYRAPETSVPRREIAVRPKRRDLRVRTRNEYVVRTDDEKLRDTVVAALYEAPGHRGELRWAYKTGQPRATKRGVVVPLTLQIPVAALTALPNGASSEGAFSVYVAWSGADGEVSEVTKSRQPFVIPDRDLERIRKGHFTYDLEVETPREKTKVAIAVVDEVGRAQGIVRVDLP